MDFRPERCDSELSSMSTTSAHSLALSGDLSFAVKTPSLEVRGVTRLRFLTTERTGRTTGNSPASISLPYNTSAAPTTQVTTSFTLPRTSRALLSPFPLTAIPMPGSECWRHAPRLQKMSSLLSQTTCSRIFRRLELYMDSWATCPIRAAPSESSPPPALRKTTPKLRWDATSGWLPWREKLVNRLPVSFSSLNGWKEITQASSPRHRGHHSELDAQRPPR